MNEPSEAHLERRTASARPPQAAQRPLRGPIARHPLVGFLGLTLAISWAPWLLLAASRHDIIAWSAPQALHLVGSLGPLLAAAVVTALTAGRAGLRALGAHMIRWRVGWGWLAVALLGPVCLWALAVLATGLVAGDWPDVRRFGQSTEFPRLPVLAYWLVSLCCYGYGEEVGWRGFLLPRLQARATALRASVLVSIVWAGWHLPLFAVPASLGHLGLAAVPGWYFSLLLGSLLLTWLYNSTRGSLLVVALFHVALDIALGSPGTPDLAQNLTGMLLTLCGFMVLHRFGPATLSRRGKQVVPARA